VYVPPICLRAVSDYLSHKHNNRCLLLFLSLPPTTLEAFALCLAWQQCKVDRMNKTYLNQSPLLWEMSTCQYNLMGKHRAGPKSQTVYGEAPTKTQLGQLLSLCTTKTQALALLKVINNTKMFQRDARYSGDGGHIVFTRAFRSGNLHTLYCRQLWVKTSSKLRLFLLIQLVCR